MGYARLKRLLGSLGFAAIISLTGSPHAFAQVTVSGPDNNGCNTGSQSYRSTYTVQPSPASPDFEQVDVYLAIAPDGFSTVCYMSFGYSFDGAPTTQQEGATQNALNLTSNQLQYALTNSVNLNPNNEITSQDTTPGPTPTPSPTPTGYTCEFPYEPINGGCGLRADGGGVRGSNDSPNGVFLNTASPAFVSFTANASANTEYVPFVIGSAAPGDSLSIFGPGGLLWSQPLSQFATDTLYFADVAGQAGSGPGAPVSLIYYISSDTETVHSSVWFPQDLVILQDTTTVPEPGTVALLSIGVIALGLFRRRDNRRQLSNAMD